MPDQPQEYTPGQVVDTFKYYVQNPDKKYDSSRAAFSELKKQFPKGTDETTLANAIRGLDQARYPWVKSFKSVQIKGAPPPAAATPSPASQAPPAADSKSGGISGYFGRRAESARSIGKEEQQRGNKASAFVNGAMAGFDETGMNLSSLGNLGTMAAIAAGGKLLGGRFKNAPKLVKLAYKALTTGFTLEMVGDLAESAPEAYQAYKRGDMEEAGRNLAKAVSDVAVGLSAYKEGKGVDRAAETPKTATPPKVEPATPAPEAAPVPPPKVEVAPTAPPGTPPPEAKPAAKKAVASTKQTAPPAVEQKAGATTELPRELKGATPRFSYRDKSIQLKFDSDIDRAAYIIANETKKSAKDAEYVKFVSQALGTDEAGARRHGKLVKDTIKSRARGYDPEEGPMVVTKGGGAPAKAARPTATSKKPTSDELIAAAKARAAAREAKTAPPPKEEPADAKITANEKRIKELREQLKQKAAPPKATSTKSAPAASGTKATLPIPKPKENLGENVTAKVLQPGGTPAETKAKAPDPAGIKERSDTISLIQQGLANMGIRPKNFEQMAGRQKYDAIRQPGDVFRDEAGSHPANKTKEKGREGIKFLAKNGKEAVVWLDQVSENPATTKVGSVEVPKEWTKEGKATPKEEPKTATPPKASSGKPIPMNEELEVRDAATAINLGLDADMDYTVVGNPRPGKYQLRDSDGSLVEVEATSNEISKLFGK